MNTRMTQPRPQRLLALPVSPRMQEGVTCALIALNTTRGGPDNPFLGTEV